MNYNDPKLALLSDAELLAMHKAHMAAVQAAADAEYAALEQRIGAAHQQLDALGATR